MDVESNSEVKSMMLQPSTPDIAEGNFTTSEPITERVQTDENIDDNSKITEEDDIEVSGITSRIAIRYNFKKTSFSSEHLGY